MKIIYSQEVEILIYIMRFSNFYYFKFHGNYIFNIFYDTLCFDYDFFMT